MATFDKVDVAPIGGQVSIELEKDFRLKLFRSERGFEFFVNETLYGNSQKSELMNEVKLHFKESEQTLLAKLEESETIYKTYVDKYHAITQPFTEESELAKEYRSIYGRQYELMPQYRALLSQYQGEPYAEVFKVLNGSSTEHKIFFVDPFAHKNPEDDIEFVRSRRTIVTLLETADPRFKSLYKNTEIPPFDEKKKLSEYNNPRLAFSITSGSPVKLNLFASANLQFNEQRPDLERAAIYGVAAKNGSLIELELTDVRTPIPLFNQFIRPTQALKPPYVVFLKSVFGLPSQRALDAYEKMKRNNQLSSMGQYPAAGWGTAEFSTYDWARQTFRVDRISSDQDKPTALLLNRNSYNTDIIKVILVGDDFESGEISPWLLKNLLPGVKIDVSLLDTLQANEARVAKDLKKLAEILDTNPLRAIEAKSETDMK